MLCSRNQKLDEIIVEILVRHPKSCVADLMRTSRIQGYDYSIKAFYKELKKLEEEGVVLKFGKNYALNLAWVIQFSSFAEEMFDNGVRAFSSEDILPAPGKSHSWRFTSLDRVNPIWTQLLGILLKQSNEKIMYEWAPHTWFFLVHPHSERAFQRALTKLHSKTYRVVKGMSNLEKLPKPIWDKMEGKTVFGRSIDGVGDNCYLDVIDNFVVSVNLDKTTTNHLNQLYSENKKGVSVDFSEIHEVLSQRGCIKLKITHNYRQAQKYKKKISNVVM